MSYKVNRNLGHQKWGVTNPWVFANYGQPQRRRGYVSPVVFQTQGPHLKSSHLGVTETETELLRRADEDLKRGERMERLAIVGVTISAFGTLMMWNRLYGKKAVTMNKRRPRRRSSRSRR